MYALNEIPNTNTSVDSFMSALRGLMLSGYDMANVGLSNGHYYTIILTDCLVPLGLNFNLEYTDNKIICQACNGWHSGWYDAPLDEIDEDIFKMSDVSLSKIPCYDYGDPQEMFVQFERDVDEAVSAGITTKSDIANQIASAIKSNHDTPFYVTKSKTLFDVTGSLVRMNHCNKGKPKIAIDSNSTYHPIINTIDDELNDIIINVDSITSIRPMTTEDIVKDIPYLAVLSKSDLWKQIVKHHMECE